MLIRASKETIPTTLTINGQGESFTFNLIYRNMRQSELEKKIREQEGNMTNVVLHMVESWELENPLTDEGIKDLEDLCPGFTIAIIQGWHKARRVTLEKN